MKSEQYWAKRMETLNEAQLQKGEAFVQQTNLEYEKAIAKIQKDVDTWYARLAKNNGVSMAEARKLLQKNELKEFRWTVDEYIKAGRENAVDQRWMKELENASAKVHISRLEALQTQMRQHVEVLTAKRQQGTSAVLGGIYKDNYYRSIFELQKGAGLGSSFAKLDTRQLENLLVKPWAPDGSNFSSRIWADRTKLVSELNTTLAQGLIRGDSSDKMITQLSERMGVSRSRAENLVLTESAYFSGASRRAAYDELGVEKYQNIATLDKRTSKTCRTMDKTIFPLSEAQPGVNCAPFHGRCRTVDIPYYEDNVKERAARGDDGKTYDVPGDMTYEDWAEEHVPKDAAPDVRPVQPNQEPTPTPVKPAEHGSSSEPSASPKPPTAADTPDPDEPRKLTQAEEAAAMRYIGGESYALNDKLRRRQPLDSGEMKWVEQLDKALTKLPRYRGDLTRTVYFPSDAALKEFARDIQPESVIQYPQYISTTSGELYNPKAQVIFYILDAGLGADMREFNPGEMEVLYGRDFPFKVIEVEILNGAYHILLRELTK